LAKRLKPDPDLRQFLGPLSVKSAEFYIHGEQIGGTAIELRWIVEAEAKGLDGRRSRGAAYII